MAALRVRRSWWARRREPVSDFPIFRELARRWRPVVRMKSTAVPLRLAVPTTEAQPQGQQSFAPKPRIVVVDAPPVRSTRTWNPWIWMK